VSLHRAHSPPLHALLVFLAVMTFGMALTVLHDVEQPGVRAFAMRTGDSEILGILVGRTHSSVLVAQGRHCRRNPDQQLVSGRLFGRIQLLRVDAHFPGWLPDPHAGPLGDVFDRAGRLLNSLRQQAGLEPYPARPACAAEGIVDATVRESSPVPEPLAGRLAARFRPRLEFDRAEHWRPLNIDRFVAERSAGKPAHRLCGAVAGCLPLSDPAQLAGATGFIDIAGEKLSGADVSTPALAACPDQPAGLPLQDCDRGPASAIYYHAVSANRRIYIDYWWFLRYNHFARADAPELCRGRILSRLNRLGALRQLGCFEHEGDWEGVTVVTREDDPEQLAYVDFAEHDDVLRQAAWELDLRGLRPRVYVADGSHATYPMACAHDCHQVFGRLLGSPRLEDDTGGTEPWGRNRAAACDDSVAPCLLSLDRAPWATFKGLWGSSACASGRAACQLGVAPRSPAQQKRFRIPWCWRDQRTGGLDCDGAPPKRAA
jgi:hypothetical protein